MADKIIATLRHDPFNLLRHSRLHLYHPPKGPSPAPLGRPVVVGDVSHGYFALNSNVHLLCSSDSENRPATFVSAKSTPAVSTVQSTFPELEEDGRLDPPKT
jgi:hypothetical protein